MTGDPVITGYGVFTAFGFGEQSLLAGPFAGRPGFRPISRFDTTPFQTRHAACYQGGLFKSPSIQDQTIQEVPGQPESSSVGCQLLNKPLEETDPPAQCEVFLACAEQA